MIRRNYISLIAFSVSVGVHAVAFIQLGETSAKGHAQAPKISTRISLSLQKEPEKVVVAKPVKPKPVKKKKSRKKVTKKIKQQPVVQQAMAKEVAKEVTRDKSELKKQVRQSYLDYVLNYIEGHKYYPHAARLRGIEGSIQVSFELQKDGSIRELLAHGKSIKLRRAAKGSVNKALPLPACPKEVDCPIWVNYAMQFKIKQ